MTSQLEQAEHLILASNAFLAHYYPEYASLPEQKQFGLLGQWRVHNPQFNRLELELYGIDVSNQINVLATNTEYIDLDITRLPAVSDDIEGEQPGYWYWEAMPDEKKGGLRFSIAVPIGLDPKRKLESLREFGSPIGVEMLVWREANADSYDYRSDRNVFLTGFANDRSYDLILASWLLEGIANASLVERVTDPKNYGA